MQTALVQCPYSGRGWARCSLRSSTCRSAASGDAYTGQDSNRRARSWAFSALAWSRDSRMRVRSARCVSGSASSVVEFHVVTTRIVISANEPGVIGNFDAALAQVVAHLGPVGHGREKPRIGSAAASSARSTIVGRFVRVVQTGRSMAEDHDQARKAAY